MLYFAHPIWLISAAGILVPVLIHLWNVREGKTLRIGSIALLKDNSNHARRIRVNELLLLFLRSLLLLFIAFLLAAPYWKRQAAQGKGWVLIDSGTFTETYSHFRKPIDSLFAKGYELHYFDTSFARIDLVSALKKKPVSSTNDYSALAQLLTRKFTHTSAYIYTPDRMERFGGPRPSISKRIIWSTFTPADSVQTFLANAWASPSGNIGILTSVYRPSGTFRSYDLIEKGKVSDRFELTAENGSPVILLKEKGKARDTILIDTSTLKIGIYAGSNPTDATWLRAALTAIRDFTGRKILVSAIGTTALPAHINWLFWLADEPPSRQIFQHLSAGSNLFSYAPGRFEKVDDTMLPEGAAEVPVNRLVPAGPKPGETKWATGSGAPLLTADKHNGVNEYHFFSRFNPSWTGLVWSSSLPLSLYPLLFPSNQIDAHDYRSVSKFPLSGEIRESTAAAGPGPASSLQEICWATILVLFGLERWYAQKRSA